MKGNQQKFLFPKEIFLILKIQLLNKIFFKPKNMVSVKSLLFA